MKVAINSQTIRVDTGKKIYDYHIEDGMSSSHLMKMMSGDALTYYRNNIQNSYECKEVSSKDPLSWGIAGKDKIDGFQYVDVDSNHGQTTTESKSRMYGYYGIGNHSPRPVVRRPAPAPKRETVNDTNKKAFRKLFLGD